MLQRQIPRVKTLKDKIIQGERINAFDLECLEDMLHYTKDILPQIKHHREYAELTWALIHLYQDIITITLQEEIGLKTFKLGQKDQGH